MGNVAGSLGPGRIAVLHPWVEGSSAGVDSQVFGLAFWWGQQLTQLGREAASSLFTVEDPKNPSMRVLARSGRPINGNELRTFMLGGLQSRFALTTEFVAPDGVKALLKSARLVEAKKGRPLRTIASWTFQPAAPSLARDAFELLGKVGRRIGLKVPHSNWQTAFGTSSEDAVHHYLNALGSYSCADFGCTLSNPLAGLGAVLAALELDPWMGQALELVPPLFRATRNQPGVERKELGLILNQARKLVGQEPEEWASLSAELGVLRVVEDEPG